MSEWGNPLRKKQPKAEKPPKEVKEKVLPKFKQEKLTLTKSEARKILNHSPTLQQTAWTQRWMEQVIRERTLPPQLAGADAYGQMMLFLNPDDALKLLEQIRSDFAKTLPLEVKKSDEFEFLRGLGELEAYHEHLLRPHTSYHNNHLSDDDL
jgi:hypothetical protein